MTTEQPITAEQTIMPGDLAATFSQTMPDNWAEMLESRVLAGYLGDSEGTRNVLRATVVYIRQSLRRAPAPVRVTDEMVEDAHKAQMSELFLRCQPDNGDVFGFMDDRKDVMRIAIEAALRSLKTGEAK